MKKIKNNKIYDNQNFLDMEKKMEERLKINNNTPEKFLKLMRSVNPIVIPRNHKVEEALDAANNNDLTLLSKLTKVLEKPYQNQKDISRLSISCTFRCSKISNFLWNLIL